MVKNIFPSSERAIARVVRDLSQDVLALADLDRERGSRIRQKLLKASFSHRVITSWGEQLPSPEVSLAFAERLVFVSPAMARVGFRLTIDEEFGCWCLPLNQEFDSKGRAKYPQVSDAANGIRGMGAHRYIWKMLIDADIPTTSHLDHLCRTHACCNPTHLQEVTPAVNYSRGNQARKIIGGQDPLFHPNSK